MCQRVMIAIAVAASPALLIADEPTTGLDVTTQAVAMDIMARLASENGMGTILITHDLALAAERSQRIAVMHAGHIVEDAPTTELLANPRHPYTRGLLAATPTAAGTLDDLHSVPGGLPDLRRADLPPCRYANVVSAGCRAAMSPWRGANWPRRTGSPAGTRHEPGMSMEHAANLPLLDVAELWQAFCHRPTLLAQGHAGADGPRGRRRQPDRAARRDTRPGG